MNMITNIFSVFDPSSSSWVLNWLRSLFVFFLLPQLFWMLHNKLSLPWKIIFETLYKEFRLLLQNPSSIGAPQISIAIFVLIFINNVSGLTPYTFTASSHLSSTLSLSLPVWIGLILYGWFNFPTCMLAHLIPQGTPSFLISFIVVIETIRNLIRPVTLAIRLAANITAGHLLLTLLGNQIAKNELVLIEPIVVLIPILLVLLEIAVALIQSYVFSTLVVLYTSETSYDN